MITKYRLTEEGRQNFLSNKKEYLKPTTKGKIMSTLSFGVGYPLDSIISQVLLDARIKETKKGSIMRQLKALQDIGYVEVFSQ